MTFDESADATERLQALDRRETEFIEQARYLSALRVAKEIRRLAKTERQLVPYIHSTFTIMNHSTDLLDPLAAREAAVELIGILESEDRARSIQPDLPEDEYDHCIYWYTSCAYDNLAKATAWLNGYNSDGMHACISDGINICRRTGKHQCVTCFREYATDVYTSADDLVMAQHYARVGWRNEAKGPHDRRWVGARDIANLYLTQGDLSASAEFLDQAWLLADDYHSPAVAKWETQLRMRVVRALLGESSKWDSAIQRPILDSNEKELSWPNRDEFPWLYFLQAECEAVELCCAGKPREALSLLAPWATQLKQKRCFDLHLNCQRQQLVALLLSEAAPSQVERAVDEIRKQAQDMRDWLTLHLLDSILEDREPLPPYPMIASPSIGPFASSEPKSKTVSTVSAEAPAAENETEAIVSAMPQSGEVSSGEEQGLLLPASATPAAKAFLASYNEGLQAAWQAAETQTEDHHAELKQLVKLSPAQLTDRSVTAIYLEYLKSRWIACSSINLTGSRAELLELAKQVWDFASALGQHHSSSSQVVSEVASIGAAILFDEATEIQEVVDEEEITQLFRTALELDAFDSVSFGKAGRYFRLLENFGEAERCLARSFRLARHDGQTAIRLAELYRVTDRSRDALMVLDTSLREGATEPELYWQAAMTAHQLGMYQESLPYFEMCQQLFSDRDALQYYHVGALLESEKFEQALAVMDTAFESTTDQSESSTAPSQDDDGNTDDTSMLIDRAHRARALAGMDRLDEARLALQQAMEIRFANVVGLTASGIASIVRHICAVALKLPLDDTLREEVMGLAIESSMVPDEVLSIRRKQGDKESGVFATWFACCNRLMSTGQNIEAACRVKKSGETTSSSGESSPVTRRQRRGSLWAGSLEHTKSPR